MARSSITGTHWFALSGKELLTLAVGVGIVLLAIGAARCIERLWGRADLTVVETGDVLPSPARLNVNEAQDYELAMLPGIGPKIAEAIIAYRREHGPFAALADLEKVSGIGPSTVEKVRPHAMCAPVRAGPAEREG